MNDVAAMTPSLQLRTEMDTPRGREVQAPDQGRNVEVIWGGLHHHYVRLAAGEWGGKTISNRPA